jgi:hypothetical protein
MVGRPASPGQGNVNFLTVTGVDQLKDFQEVVGSV